MVGVGVEITTGFGATSWGEETNRSQNAINKGLLIEKRIAGKMWYKSTGKSAVVAHVNHVLTLS